MVFVDLFVEVLFVIMLLACGRQQQQQQSAAVHLFHETFLHEDQKKVAGLVFVS